jgi:NDP-sugar pyrophosphorylase family protein
MLNVLIPMAGKSQFFDRQNYYFPKPLIEINDRMMIEWVIDAYRQIRQPVQYLFVINAEDAARFHLDNILRLIAGKDAIVLEQPGDTGGALCSSLLMVDHIDNDTPLIIANSDQVIDVDYNAVLADFARQDADAGTIVFKSFHPQWSYALIEDGQIVETAEKKPISSDAIAGTYYFRRGRDFAEAAKRVILKDARVHERFFLSSSFNEMILTGKKLVAHRIEPTAYHSFYSPAVIEKFVAASKLAPASA